MSNLQQLITSQLPKTIKPSARKWLRKEIVKANLATQFIGRGAPDSSTDRYEKLYSSHKAANTGHYTSDDIIWVSCNGKRNARVPVTVNGKLHDVYNLIDLAIEANAMIIADTAQHINNTRYYNIGEIELQDYLLAHNYERDKFGLWSLKEK